MKKINFLLMLLMLAFASEALAWKPIMIGHRGCRMGVENTEAAFINGANLLQQNDRILAEANAAARNVDMRW